MKRDSEQIALSQSAARWYRSRGFNPLPSRRDRKQPTLPTYSKERDEGITDEILESWDGHNVQLATGVKWGLLVVDMDGPEAVRVFTEAVRDRKIATWKVNRNGHESGHFYFRPPPWMGRAPYLTLWEKGGDKIELIGDGRLIMAPPSIHPETGERYRFTHDKSVKALARLPPFVCQRIEAIQNAKKQDFYGSAFQKVHRGAWAGSDDYRSVMGKLNRRDVMEIAERVGIAPARFEPNSQGWLPCYRDSDDRNPSASFNVYSGAYWTNRGDKTGLFELLVSRGEFPTIQDAIDGVKSKYLGGAQ